MLFVPIIDLLRSTTFRIAAMFMVLFTGAALALSSLFYFSTERNLEQQASGFVDALLVEAIDFFEESGLDGLVEEANERTVRDPGSNTIYVIYDENCVPIAGAANRLPPNMSAPAFCNSLLAANGKLFFDLERRYSSPARQSGEGSGRGEDDDEAVSRILELSTGDYVYVVRAIPEIEETREFVGKTIVWSMALMIVLGLLGAIFFTRIIVARIERINSISRDIRRGNLALRVPIDNTGDEFDVLAKNLNIMLDRIELLVEGVRQVSNSVAHDLRTPLTRMHTHLERLGSESIDPDKRRELIDRTLAESDALLGMFNALLRISGIESGSAGAHFDDVNLALVIEDAVDLFEPLATENEVEIRVRLDRRLTVQGDKNLLFQVFENLIENAIKYTPAGGKVDVDLRAEGGAVVAIIEDDGPGIPPDERERVFERFYRLEEHRSSPGSGLGLSLVKAATNQHRASFVLDQHDRGLRCSMIFKL